MSANNNECVDSTSLLSPNEDGRSQRRPQRRKMSAMGAAFLRGGWPEAMEMIEPTVNCLVYYKGEAPKLDAFVKAFEATLWPSPFFNSCMADGGYWEARHDQMDLAYHFEEVHISGDAGIEAWVQEVMMTGLDRAYPAWRLHVLRAPRGSRSAIFFRCHHAIGDGLALLFAFSPSIGCEDGNDPLHKIPLPNILLPPAARSAQAPSQRRKGGICSCCKNVPSFFKGALIAAATKHDSELSINAPLADRTPFLRFNRNRVFTRFPCVPMSAIKAVREAYGCSVNDVLMAALTGALRRYGAEVRGDERLQDQGGAPLEFKSLVMMALPRDINWSNPAESMANRILFASCALPINEATPRGRLKRTVAAFEDLKSTAYIAGLGGFTNFAQSVLPTRLLRKAIAESFSKHSLLVTNVPAMTVPCTFPKVGGALISEAHMVFPNIIPQVSIITYAGYVNANIVADPALYPDAAVLGRLWEAEFALLAQAAAER